MTHLIVIIIYLAVTFGIGSIATEYTVEFWLSYFKNQPVDAPFWACLIAAPFVGSVTIPAAILTWLISFGL